MQQTASPGQTVVLAVAVDPFDSTHILIGTTTGGYFATRDTGATWNEGIGALGSGTQVNAIAFDPVVRDRIYVAYGRYPYAPYGGNPQGFAVSNDAGNSWTVSAAIPEGTAIGVSPLDHTVYVGNFGGSGSPTLVFKTEDLGKTAELVFTTDSVPWAADCWPQIGGMAVDSSTPGTIYLALSCYGHGAIAKTTDSGHSWRMLDGGLGDRPFQAIAIDSANHIVLYAGVGIGNPYALQLSCGPFSGPVFRSDDAGETWQHLGTPYSSSSIETIQASGTGIYLGSDWEGVIESQDSGATWGPANHGLTATTVSRVAFDPLSSSTIFATVSGYGLFETTDSGQHWSEEDLGTVRGNLTGVAIDPVNPQLGYVACQEGGYYDGYSATVGDSFASDVYRTTDGGLTWRRTGLMANTKTNGGFVCDNCIVSDLEIAPSDHRVLYAASGLSLYRSSDGGATWLDTDSDQFAWSQVSVAINPVDANDVLVGVLGDGIGRSTDGGQSWSNPLSNVTVSSLARDRILGESAIALALQGTFLGTNGGASWTSGTSLPTGGSAEARADPAVSGTFYAASIDPFSTDPSANALHVFESQDMGHTWTESLRLGVSNYLYGNIGFAVSQSGDLGLGMQGIGVLVGKTDTRNVLELHSEFAEVMKGKSSGITVSGRSANGGAILLRAVGLPAGVGASFSPTSISSGTVSSLTLTASSLAQPGLYVVTVEGQFGAQKIDRLLRLRVTPSADPRISEVHIPSVNGRPQSICTGTDGALWFLDPVANTVNRLTPGGELKAFRVPTSRAGLWGIVAAPAGVIWFTENAAARIGRVDSSGTITEFPVPQFGRPAAIALGPDNAIWYTDGSTYNGNAIGRMSRSGEVTRFNLPHFGGEPVSIVTGADGALWFTEYAGNAIGRIDVTGEVKNFPIPTPASFPVSIAAGADGTIWFLESIGKVGRLSAEGKVFEYQLPSPDASPNSIILGPDGNLWFTEETADQVGTILSNGSIHEYSIPSSGGMPFDLTWGPDGSIWFSEAMRNGIGRIALNGPPPKLPGARLVKPVMPPSISPVAGR